MFTKSQTRNSKENACLEWELLYCKVNTRFMEELLFKKYLHFIGNEVAGLFMLHNWCHKRRYIACHLSFLSNTSTSW